MDQREGKVLEEEETEELAHPDVGPASVHQQEALQVAELAEGVVAGHGGLHALLPADPDADVCGWTSGGTEEGKERRSPASFSNTNRRRFPALASGQGGAPFGPPCSGLLLIMLTSLAPSPMDSVTAFLYFFTRLTTLAFCLGVTRQQMTASHSQAMLTKSTCGRQWSASASPACLSPGRFARPALHLSHLFLPVVHGLAVLRAARRRPLSEAAQAQAAAFFLLLVQNFVLKEREREREPAASSARWRFRMKADRYSGSPRPYQPPSGDDERIFARPAEERLCGLPLAHAHRRRLGSPVSLANPQFLTGGQKNTAEGTAGATPGVNRRILAELVVGVCETSQHRMRFSSTHLTSSP